MLWLSLYLVLHCIAFTGAQPNDISRQFLAYAETVFDPPCGSSADDTRCLQTFEQARYTCNLQNEYQQPANLSNASYARSCFCSVLQRSSACFSICNLTSLNPSLEQTVDYFNNTCGNLPGWRLPIHPTTAEAFLPWPWTVAFNASEVRGGAEAGVSCPPSTASLGTFAAVNLVILLLTPIFGRRDVARALTGGLMGGPEFKAWSQVLATVLSVLLQIGACALNAYIIKSAPGFSSTSIVQLMLLFMVRPRLAWLSVQLVHFQAKKAMYFTSGASSLWAEVIMQLFSLYPMGVTTHFARKKGYYQAGNLRYSSTPTPPSSARLMYAGAILWIGWICCAIVVGLINFLGMAVRLKRISTLVKLGESSGTQEITSRDAKKILWGLKLSHTEEPPPREGYGQPVIALAIFIYPFIGQWLFWSGFIILSGDLYCPQRLHILGISWALSSLLGVLIGAAL